ncbi:endodeoxyribonuclease, partial [Escherichia coli]|uniref:RusA family crossover junction endodeoxyribonuclease n=1 Tax=Escherichia coli TaxID=562 RepID=UPI000B3F1E42
MRIEFVLPYPSTVTTYWRSRGSTYFVSKDGERYRRAVALIVSQQWLKYSLSGRLAINITAAIPAKLRRDLDKIRKTPRDAMTTGGVLIDAE